MVYFSLIDLTQFLDITTIIKRKVAKNSFGVAVVETKINSGRWRSAMKLAAKDSRLQKIPIQPSALQGKVEACVPACRSAIRIPIAAMEPFVVQIGAESDA